MQHYFISTEKSWRGRKNNLAPRKKRCTVSPLARHRHRFASWRDMRQPTRRPSRNRLCLCSLLVHPSAPSPRVYRSFFFVRPLRLHCFSHTAGSNIHSVPPVLFFLVWYFAQRRFFFPPQVQSLPYYFTCFVGAPDFLSELVFLHPPVCLAGRRASTPLYFFGCVCCCCVSEQTPSGSHVCASAPCARFR